jgi:hypothetical protein
MASAAHTLRYRVVMPVDKHNSRPVRRQEGGVGPPGAGVSVFGRRGFRPSVGARVCNPQRRARVKRMGILLLRSCERAADCKSAVRGTKTEMLPPGDPRRFAGFCFRGRDVLQGSGSQHGC